MMQAAQTRKGHDLAELGWLHGAVVRGVLAKSEVNSVPVVPVAELAEDTLGVALVHHDHVVETLPVLRQNPFRRVGVGEDGRIRRQ